MEEGEAAVNVSAREEPIIPDNDPSPSVAPPSSSALSDVPNTDSEIAVAQPKAIHDEVAPKAPLQLPQYSAQTEELVRRINANSASAAKAGTPGYDAAKEQIMKNMATSHRLSTPPPVGINGSKRGGRGGKRSSFTSGSHGNDDSSIIKAEDDGIQATPGLSGRGRGRGRGGGRPRGKSRGSGRGSKRKRDDDDDDDDTDSDEVTPIATMTKSGRSVNKPTSFVPPPAPSPTVNKRKRTFTRNPQSAVCKTCLRGTSPAGNMIVFCDGCNTPYHRYCHHPPIDQAVVDEVEREWYCRSCEKARLLAVPDSDVADFVSAPGVSVEERKRYFSGFPPGVLATLLTKATTLYPDLPMFAPDFKARHVASTTMPPDTEDASSVPNGHAQHTPAPTEGLPPAQSRFAVPSADVTPQISSHSPVDLDSDQEMAPYGDQHPPNYPRPGHGLMKTLPREQDDLEWLVDDEDEAGVFTHLYQSDPMAANAPANTSNGQISG